jgi:HJR/Mrr/RecB family endonuclease/TolA-binding protein
MLFLGQRLKLEYFDKTPLPEPLTVPIEDLIKHLFICGVTGAGKTVLGKILVEEAALRKVPAIVVDLKGDLSSLALRFPALRAEEFEPWVDVPRQGDRATQAAKEADRFKQQLGRFGLSARDVAKHCSRVEISVFTPRSNRGFRLALSPFVEELSGNLAQLMAEDPDAFVEMLDALSASFVKHLTFRKREKQEKAKSYIFELVKYACKMGVNLQGEEGLRNLIRLIEKPPISHVAARLVDDFIGPRERAELANEVNNLLAGAGQLWFSGLPFYLDDFVSCDDPDKTPINIINVSGMNHEDQSFVISHLTFSIYLWMKRQGGSQEPKLLFYIDEIGAGGGSLAFYPSHPYNPPSKPGINLLVRQGRSFGVCCVLVTQSPGDVDYKGLGQCQTWIVGKLQRVREIKKIEEGASAAAFNFKGLLKFIPDLDVGEFLVKSASGELSGLKERWLYSYHKCLSPEEIGKIKSMYEHRAEAKFAEALRAQEGGKHDEAVPVWRDFAKTFRYSGRYPEALLNLGKCFFALKQYDEAIKTLEKLEKRSYDRAILSEAWFLLAKCRREKLEYETAEQLFQKVVTQSDEPQRKQEAFIWGEYCGQAWRWQLPHELENLHLWFQDSPHTPKSLKLLEAVGLQPRADNIILEQLPPRLPIEVLRVPEPLPIFGERKKPVEVAEEEIREKRATIRQRASTQLDKARQAVKARNLASARKLYQNAITDYRAAGLEPEPDIWAELDSFNLRIAEYIEIRREKIQRMDGHEFEIQIGRLYKAMGYNVRITASDGGIDVWAYKDNSRVIIQCKHWKNPIGPGEIREFNGSQFRKVADEAVFISSSTFTEQAKAEASMAGIKLIDGTKLIDLFAEFYVEDPTSADRYSK